jgi:hypothetical protein
MTSMDSGRGRGIIPIQYIERPEMFESHIQEYQPWNSLRLIRLNPTENERRVTLQQRQEMILTELQSGADSVDADCILLKPFRFEYYGYSGTKLTKYQTGSLTTRLEAVIRGRGDTLKNIMVIDWARLRLNSSPRNHIPIQGYGFITL